MVDILVDSSLGRTWFFLKYVSIGIFAWCAYFKRNIDTENLKKKRLGKRNHYLCRCWDKFQVVVSKAFFPMNYSSRAFVFEVLASLFWGGRRSKVMIVCLLHWFIHVIRNARWLSSLSNKWCRIEDDSRRFLNLNWAETHEAKLCFWVCRSYALAQQVGFIGYTLVNGKT